jgi:phage repressor protein C with HTH and peptisase S24 domain
MNVITVKKKFVENGIKTFMRNDNSFIIEMPDDSMRGSIERGDLLNVVPVGRGFSDGIYAVRIGVFLFVRRIQFMGDIIRISADNQNYLSWTVEEERADIEFIGRVKASLNIRHH